MWKAIRDAIKSDEATARFVKILVALTIMFAVLGVVMWAVSAPSAADAFKVIIGLLGAGQPFSMRQRRSRDRASCGRVDQGNAQSSPGPPGSDDSIKVVLKPL
jgi:hypothetical protein